MLFLVIVSRIFETLEVDFNIFSDPFSTVVDQSPDHLQLELIDMQSDNDMKRGFGENDLASFYKNYVRGKHPNIAEHAFAEHEHCRTTLPIISLFGSTYCCEQFLFKDETLQRKAQRSVVRPTLDWSASSCSQFCESKCSETL